MEPLTITAFLIWIATYQIVWFSDSIELFDIGIAITILLMTLAIHVKGEGRFKIFSLTFVLLAISNIFDELIFQPCNVSFHEYMAGLIILSIMIYKLWAYGKN